MPMDGWWLDRIVGYKPITPGHGPPNRKPCDGRPKRRRDRPERENGKQLRSDWGKRAPTVLRGLNQVAGGERPETTGETRGNSTEEKRNRKDCRLQTETLNPAAEQITRSRHG